MVDYPALTPDAITKPIQSSLSPGEVAGPYSLLANGLKKVGAAAEDVASSIADQQGLKAVTRDADGNIQVRQAPYFGKAAEHYSNAVKFAALAQGEGEARRKDIELRQQFRDNPEGYNAAAKTFMDGLQDQYTKAAGPLVGMSLRKAVELTTTQTYKGLLTEKEHLDLVRSSEAMNSELEYASNQRYALANQGVTSGKDWDDLTDKIRTIRRQQVENPRLGYSPVKARADEEKDVSNLQGAATGYRAVQMYRDRENGGYDKAIEFANGIRTDRSLNLSPVQRDALAGRAISQVNAAARDDKRIVNGVAADITAVNKLSLTGTPPSPDRMGQVRAAVEQTGNPQLRQMMDQAEGVAQWAKDARHMTPAQLEQSRNAIEADMREHGSNEMGETLVKAHDKMIKAARDGITKDQLGWADRTGFMPVPPIQFGSPDAAGQMVDRAARAKIVAQQYGVEPRFFRQDEKIALEAAVSAGGPQMEAVAKLMVDGFGADAPAAMKELSKSAPTLAHIGALQMSGGDPGFTHDVTEGVKMRGDKEFMDQLPTNMKKPTEAVFGAQSERRQEVYGSAFALLPDQAEASQEAAGNAFFSRAYRNHYDVALGKEKGAVPPGLQGRDPSVKAYDQALQQSAGAHFIGDVQYGGVAPYKAGGFWNTDMGKVLVPTTVKANRFRDVIGAITDEDLRTAAISPEKADGTPYRAADLRNALPVKVKGGYAFAQGDPTSADPKFIRGALGSPFVLDFDQMEPKLRQRVPDAFLGGPQHHSMLEYLNPIGTANATERRNDPFGGRPDAGGAAGPMERVEFKSSGAVRGEAKGARPAPVTETPEQAATRKAEMKAAFDKLMEKGDGRKMIIDLAEQLKAGRLDFKSLK